MISRLWTEYKSSGSHEARDGLIIHYSPLVKYVAGRVSVGLPQRIDQADLVSYGVFGLIDAMDKFDPGRNIKFETYAIARIKAAIIGELRSIDWIPRSIRAKARCVEKAYAKLEASLLRTPTDAEVAEEMGLSESELQKFFQQVSSMGLVALDEMLSPGGEQGVSTKGDGPTQAMEGEESKEVLADAIKRLADPEKTVLTLYYYEGFTLAEIGDVLGVTVSRVYQIYGKATLQLRSWLNQRPDSAAD